ncbi:MAG TPA: hypothetical protein DCW41_01135 [Clostridiales bacterium]|nr:hypothetical protein [Clostridiales bacterium]
MKSDVREPSAIALLERLEDEAYSDSVLFGQQNAGHIGITLKRKDGTESDIKNLTGSNPGIVGIDTLSFYGYEGNMDDLVKTVKNLHKQGVIITLSSHMPNFSLGGDSFFDYSPNITDGDIGRRILPGGDLHAKYLRFLDDIASFASECVDLEGERIPMIFRPFHECNGDWFWWGGKNLSPEDYIKLFRFTIDYLRDEKGIKNFLYCYSPNGRIHSCESFMDRYPGDDYVDVMGVDQYDDRPEKDSEFFKDLICSLEYVGECAQNRGKVYALTEVGLRTLDSNPEGYFEGLAPEGNRVPDWYSRLLEALLHCEAGLRCAYMLTWSNFSETQFWVPYETADFRHEMCDDFVRFCDDPHIKLAPAN